MSRKTRPIRIEGDVAYVPLTKGYEAIIDSADVDLVKHWNWCAALSRRSDGSIMAVYAIRNVWNTDGTTRTILMHRLLAQTAPKMETDHIDGNGLNNRRSNLRPATVSQNQQNSRRRQGTKSGVKGVCFDRAKGKWRADIKVSGRNVFLGYFDCIENAGAAYANGSAHYHGEFGRPS